jgi:hypothetical protein
MPSDPWVCPTNEICRQMSRECRAESILGATKSLTINGATLATEAMRLTYKSDDSDLTFEWEGGRTVAVLYRGFRQVDSFDIKRPKAPTADDVVKACERHLAYRAKAELADDPVEAAKEARLSKSLARVEAMIGDMSERARLPYDDPNRLNRDAYNRAAEAALRLRRGIYEHHGQRYPSNAEPDYRLPSPAEPALR